MRSKWQVKDLVDLEYFLNQTADNPSQTASDGELSSDRRLYLAYEKNHQPPFSRRDLIKYWLDGHRNARKKISGRTDRLPGEAYSETISLLRSLIVIAAFLSGAALAWSVMSYGGTAPINIFTCIWVMIVPQFILLTILGLSLLFSRLGLNSPFKGIYTLFSSLILRMARHAKRAGETTLPADYRTRIYAMAGLIGQQKTLYGSVFFWPIFILAQIFGVFFNLGLFCATILKLAITDLAFGWQSTLQPDPKTVYRIIDIFSLPWSWVSSAHPSIHQIQGSQMILKDGMTNLSTPDLVSWWPFLCFALLFYGLFPRLILLATGIYQQNNALGRISFSTSVCDRLIQRMRSPLVQSSGRNYSPSHSVPLYFPQADKAVVQREIKGTVALDPAIVFVPDDIDRLCNDDDLKERIAHILGLKVVSRVRFEMDPKKDMIELETVLSRTGLSPAGTRMVILMEAWQPPIRETILWLNRLRNTVNKNTGLIIALIGKPANRMIFTSPDNTDRVVWEQAINGLGDPFIRVENLGGC